MNRPATTEQATRTDEPSLTVSVPAGLASELVALEVDTLDDSTPLTDWDRGRVAFVEAFNAAPRRADGSLRLTLTGGALRHAARDSGAFGNAADVLWSHSADGTQGAASKARAAERIHQQACAAISAHGEAQAKATGDVDGKRVVFDPSRWNFMVFDVTVMDLMVDDLDLDSARRIQQDPAYTTAAQRREATPDDPDAIAGSASSVDLPERRQDEVELEDGGTAIVDPDVAEQVEAGYSVGEAEAIVDHDEGFHEDEPEPGCPRCEDDLVANLRPGDVDDAPTCSTAMGRGGTQHPLVEKEA